jgi:hypothetical protein
MADRRASAVGRGASFIELKQRCESQMSLKVCSGCDACGLRCAAGVPASGEEWADLQRYIADAREDLRQEIRRTEAQDKTVDLGDGVSVQMCRYRDMEMGRCVVYPARPLMCRLLGHVEWMPCPIAKVPHIVHTPDALALMEAYAALERKTFEVWESEGSG